MKPWKFRDIQILSTCRYSKKLSSKNAGSFFPHEIWTLEYFIEFAIHWKCSKFWGCLILCLVNFFHNKFLKKKNIFLEIKFDKILESRNMTSSPPQYDPPNPCNVPGKRTLPNQAVYFPLLICACYNIIRFIVFCARKNAPHVRK